MLSHNHISVIKITLYSMLMHIDTNNLYEKKISKAKEQITVGNLLFRFTSVIC